MVHELLLELRAGGAGADALTARESQVLGMLRRGQSTAAIAERLQITPVTVRRHISELVRKLGVADRSELINSEARGRRAHARRVTHVRRRRVHTYLSAVKPSEVRLRRRRLVFGINFRETPEAERHGNSSKLRSAAPTPCALWRSIVTTLGIQRELQATFIAAARLERIHAGRRAGALRGRLRRVLRRGSLRGVSSGTAALSLMFRAHGIGPGDEVIVPGHTFIASALAVAHVGATPVLCEVDEATGLIDPEAARAAVGQRTAAVLAVHLYGQACDMAAIESFAKPRGLLVFEDAAQAHGATLPRPASRLAGRGRRVLVLPDEEPRSARGRRRDLHRRRADR